MPTLTEGEIQQLIAAVLGRTNIRPRSITEDKLARGAASAAIVRDRSISDVHIGELTVTALSAGTIDSESIVVTGTGGITSSNFVSGSAGFSIGYDGNVEFVDGTFSGTIEAGDIHIPDQVTANSFHVDTSGQMWLGATAFAGAPFRVDAAGNVTANNLTATGAVVSGALTAGPSSSIPGTYLDTGTTAANLTIGTGGWIRSAIYTPGDEGFAIDAGGTAEFNEATIRGDLLAGTISIGSTGAFNVDSSGNVWCGTASSYVNGRNFKVNAGNGYVYAPFYNLMDETDGTVEGAIGYNEGGNYLYWETSDSAVGAMRMQADYSGQSVSLFCHTNMYFRIFAGNMDFDLAGSGAAIFHKDNAGPGITITRDGTTPDAAPYIDFWGYRSAAQNRFGYMGFANNDDLRVHNECPSGNNYFDVADTGQAQHFQFGSGIYAAFRASDVSTTVNTGYLVLGSTSGLQLGMDSNEIQARNGSSASILNIQNGGGDLDLGSNTSAIINLRGPNVRIPNIGTLASGSGANMRLQTTDNEPREETSLRSTKKDNDYPVPLEYARRMLHSDLSIMYQSVLEGDDRERWTPGAIAERVEEVIGPEMCVYRDMGKGPLMSVLYDRWAILQNVILEDLDKRLEALEGAANV